MVKFKNTDDLQRIKEEVLLKTKLRDNSNSTEQIVQVKVGMATCGIASGAREIMQFMVEELEQQAIDAVVSQTGCIGFCYAEPTIEVKLPGKESLVFGYLDKTKAQEIIQVYIKMGKLVDGILPLNFRTIDD